MFRKTTLLAGALALVLIAPQAHAAAGEWMVNLNGGIATPLGDFKDAAKLGFMGGVGVDYMATEAFAVGVDGAFISNKGSDLLNQSLTDIATLIEGTPTTVEGKFTMIQGGVHAKYMFPMAAESSIAPYVVGGLGIYNMKSKTESSNSSYVGDSSESKFGARGGLGLMFKTSEKVGIGVEGAFHWINTDVSSTQFIGIQAGVSIGMGTPAQ